MIPKKWHRWLNTTLTSLVLVGLIFGGRMAYAEFQDISLQKGHVTEMAQIVRDEGFRECAYSDTKSFKTIGFGHLIHAHERFKCITPQRAIELLQSDYYEAWNAVERNFPWAEGEVKLVLTNMSYQIGITKLMKFKKTTKHMYNENFTMAAMEMIDSKWYKETPKRSMRLAVRILALQE